MKKKLIMTLLVRDEEDILEYNICHHLNQGVDFIIAIDNGSTDRTVEILKKYQKKGVLKYSVINKHTYEQDVWVSQMAKEAVKKYGATHLFHCDADEFWYETNGNLKNQINNIKDVGYVSLINYIPPDIMIKRFNFDNFRYMVSNPILYPHSLFDMKSSKVLIYEYPKKIITSKKFTDIDYGNHRVKYDGKISSKQLINIFIHHFPIRSYMHFQKKVINGGTAYLNNPIKDPNIGWQWKKWYSLYLNNKLEEEYKKLSLKTNLSQYLIKSIVQKTRVPNKIKFAKIVYFFTEIKNKFRKL